jgi:hypothetical protein
MPGLLPPALGQNQVSTKVGQVHLPATMHIDGSGVLLISGSAMVSDL